MIVHFIERTRDLKRKRVENRHATNLSNYPRRHRDVSIERQIFHEFRTVDNKAQVLGQSSVQLKVYQGAEIRDRVREQSRFVRHAEE